MKIRDLFHMQNGNSFEFSTMTNSEPCVNFVSRTGGNNGVSGVVDLLESTAPFKAGNITVALSGSVLSSFVQVRDFYTAFHVMVLIPKKEMSLPEKLYYCHLISINKYRYSYGRQANKTLSGIELPNFIPEWVYAIDIGKYKQRIKTLIRKQHLHLNTNEWKEFRVGDLFDVKYGVNLELSHCHCVDNKKEGINFVARTAYNNGVVARVKYIEGVEAQDAGLITCAAGGSVLATFVQAEPFYSGRDLYILKSKDDINIYHKLFCCVSIKFNSYKYAYGRQANKTIRDIFIKLPGTIDGHPNWELMESFIKSLPFSDRI